MYDYCLKMKHDGLFYCVIYLKADNREEAIKQSNEIMNRFPEPEYTATVIEKNKDQHIGNVFSWFN